MGLVLVVEDEVDLNNLIRDQLVAAGHSVEQAFDGQTAAPLLDGHGGRSLRFPIADRARQFVRGEVDEHGVAVDG